MALMELIFTSTFDIQGKSGFRGMKWQKECGYTLSVTVIDIDSGHRQVHDIYSGKGMYYYEDYYKDNPVNRPNYYLPKEGYRVDLVECEIIERNAINFLSNLDNAGWNVIDLANRIQGYYVSVCPLTDKKPSLVKEEKTIRINKK